MINVNCYNCGSNRKEPYTTENGYNLVKCLDCGLLYVTPRPSAEEIAQAAQCGLHKGESTLNVTNSFNIKKIQLYQKVLNDLYGVEFTRRKSTWLDIGCGHGEFLIALKKFSNDNIIVKGVEPNIHKQKSAQKRGLDVSFFDIKSHNVKYDVISLLNVYSHLDNPLDFLNQCSNMLTENGELVLQTGDAAHLSEKDIYRPLYLPDHLSIASEKIVSNILLRAGFEIVAVYKYPFIKSNFIILCKEFIKQFWPKKISNFRYMLSRKYNTDMYIRAKKRH